MMPDEQQLDDNITPENQIQDNGVITTARGIQALTIIGQIEGHYILPGQNKTTKYEHILPALVEMEENDEIRVF